MSRKGRNNDLIIVIPGILGSRLARREGERLTPVWDLSSTRLIATLRAARAGGLAYTGPMDGPADDGIEAVGLLEIPSFVPGFIGVDGYGELVYRLRKRLGVDRVKEFPYDWRLSNRVTAERLDALARAWLGAWRERSGSHDAQLVLIGHSMGGLVARYFREVLGGHDITRSIITIGTPHRGSMMALDALENGKRFTRFLDLTDTIRTLPSVYELLPSYRCINRAGSMLRLSEVRGELTPSTEERLDAALGFHDEIERGVDERSDRPVVTVFSNRRHPTSLSAAIDTARVALLPTHVDADVASGTGDRKLGDGTVPWFSAIPREWDDDAEVAACGVKHAALQTVSYVIDTICNRIDPSVAIGLKGAVISESRILQLSTPSHVEVSGDRKSSIGLAVLSPGPGRVRVDVDELREATDSPVVSPGITSRFVQTLALGVGGGSCDTDPLDPGVYRVTARIASVASQVDPVSDLVVVLPQD